MGKDTFHYTNGEVTVVWKPNQCIHSTKCWKGLIEVFNPKRRPWIKMDAATTDIIVAQVKKCPSAALSYFMNAEKQNSEVKSDQGEEVSPNEAVIKVEVSENGPYLIKSECIIVHSDGREEVKTGNVALCRCGGSSNKPYCDGSHRKSDFKG